MTRAEKFEDERRRIIESCFGKKEADGSSMYYTDLGKFKFRFLLFWSQIISLILR